MYLHSYFIIIKIHFRFMHDSLSLKSIILNDYSFYLIKIMQYFIFLYLTVNPIDKYYLIKK